MGDPSREKSDRLQLLGGSNPAFGNQQRPLRPLAFQDVDGQHDNGRDKHHDDQTGKNQPRLVDLIERDRGVDYVRIGRQLIESQSKPLHLPIVDFEALGRIADHRDGIGILSF